MLCEYHSDKDFSPSPPNMNRIQLFDALSNLSPHDFERLIVSVNMPRMNRAGASAKIGEQVSALLDWADSEIGPGVDAIADYLAELNHFEFDNYLQSIIATYEKWWEHYTITDALGKVEQAQPEQSSIFDFALMVQTVTKDQEPTDLENTSLQKDKEKTERLPVLDGIRKYADSHVLLVGRPGSGKSTALIRLVLEVATETLKEGQGQIPILVELRYWQTSVIERIQAFLHQHDPILSLDNAALNALLRQGRFLLLIDGLNELPSDEARTQLASFRRDHPKVPMIFTTRDLGLGGDLGIEKKLEMQPLTEPQMKAFVRAYVPDQAEAMLRQLNNRLREFGQTPLLLWMLCEVFQRSPNQQMPTNLAEVFRAFTAMYEDSSVRKHEVALLKGDVRPLSDRRLWKEALKALAALMMQGETPVDFRVAIHRTEAERELGQLFAKEKFPVRDILDDLLKYHLLQNRTTDQLEFRHQLIQEYYAAEYLLDLLPVLSDEQLKQGYLNLLKWTEAIALMLALVSNDAQALRVMKLAIDDVDLMLGARLAGEVLFPYQSKTIGWISALDIDMRLKVELLKTSQSEAAVPALIEALKHPTNYHIRKTAVLGLSEIGSEAAIRGLLNALKHPDADIRLTIAHALSDLGNEAGTHVLLSTFEDPNSSTYMRAKAVDGLRRIASEEAVEGLCRVLVEDSDSVVRRIAVDGLAAIGSERATQGLLTALEDSDFEIRMHVIDESRRIRSEEAVQVLLTALKDSDPEVRMYAIDGLRRIRSEEVIQDLRNVLEDPDSNVRRSAEKAIESLFNALEAPDSEVRRSIADELDDIGSESAIKDLCNALGASNHRVCRRAADRLRKIGSAEAIEGLRKALQHSDSVVRGIAVDGLGEIGSNVVISDLLNALADSEPAVRWIAACRLGKIGGEAAIEGLRKALEDSDSYVFDIAVDGLSKLGSEVPILDLLLRFDTLERLYSDVDSRTVDELGEIGSDTVIPGLLKALGHLDDFVRMSAVHGLSEIGSKAAIPSLLTALKNPDSYVRQQVVKALGKIGNKSAIHGLLTALEDPVFEIHEAAAYELGNISSPIPIASLWRQCRHGLEGKDSVPVHPTTALSQRRGYRGYRLEAIISHIQNRCKFYNYEIFIDNFVPQGKTIALYFSYAPADEALQAQLKHHLALLERQGVITRWSSHQILPGDNRTQTIHQQLNTADIILLLISSDAIADDTCYHLEIQRVMERHQSGEARVIPILLRPVDWQSAPFSQLNVLPKNHQPVTTWPNPDQAFQEIAEGIRAVAMEMRREKDNSSKIDAL
ncbi:hypothetical protein C8255_15460 [filamentous cyanobacterium CCP3]|nr:hypothetical protein C8255_15460 [filamentous cyanobacterium CCP3]